MVTLTDRLRTYIHDYLAPGEHLESAFRLGDAFNALVTDVQAARDELVVEGLLRQDGPQYVVTNTLPSDDKPDTQLPR